MVKRCFILLMAMVLCLTFISAEAFAIDYVGIDKVLIQTYPGQGGNDLPYVDGDISAFYAATSTAGVAVSGWSLVDDSGVQCVGKVEQKNYTMNITVSSQAMNYVFTENTKGYINNEPANISISADKMSATFSRYIYPRLIGPTIWHNPTDEKHDAGECFSFAASASPYYRTFQWYLKSPYNETYEAEKAGEIFDGTSAAVFNNGDRGVSLNLYNVSQNFNGWFVYCVFKGVGGETPTSMAQIIIKNAATPTPEPTIEIVTTPEPTPESTTEPQSTEELNPGITIVEHDFASEWSYDDDFHWHEDLVPTSDEVSEKGPHDMVWTEVRSATKKEQGEEKGVCSVCGLEQTRSVEYVKAKKTSGLPNVLKWIVGIVGGIVVLAVLVLFIQYIKDKKRRARRARMAGRHGKH